jgi:peptide subunit release factor 1 (eRF1)
LASFKRFLPERLLAKVVATLPFDRNTSEPAILEHVRRTLESCEREQEEKLVGELIQRAMSHRLAVLGVHDTLQAILTKQVYELLVNAAFNALGWHCGSCGAIGDGSFSLCARCGVPASQAEVGEAMMQAVLRQGGMVHVVHNHPHLQEVGGVGALLRY